MCQPHLFSALAWLMLCRRGEKAFSALSRFLDGSKNPTDKDRVIGESESEVTQLCLTLCDPWIAIGQAPPSMGFSRQEYWSGLPFLSPGDLPDPGEKCTQFNGFFVLYLSCIFFVGILK